MITFCITLILNFPVDTSYSERNETRSWHVALRLDVFGDKPRSAQSPMFDSSLQENYSCPSFVNISNDKAGMLCEEFHGRIFLVSLTSQSVEPRTKNYFTYFSRVLSIDPTGVSVKSNEYALQKDEDALVTAEKKYQNAVLWFGETHQKALTALNNLASLHYQQGAYQSSKQLSEKALSLSRKAVGDQHILTIESLNNLATSHQALGAYNVAKPLYEEALKACEKEVGASHPKTLILLNNLGLLYRRQGNSDKAKPLFEKALFLSQKELGDHHLLTWSSLNNLALLYLNKGTYDEAKPLLERALSLSIEILGEHHPSTLVSLTNLAEWHREQGDYSSAVSLIDNAWRLTRKALGERHPNSILVLNNLAMLYQNQGAYETALPLFEKALNLSMSVFGERHFESLKILNNLAMLYQLKGMYKKAHSLLEKALLFNSESLGESHIQSLVSINNLALSYQKQGNYKASEPLYIKAVRLSKGALGELHPNTLNSMNNLATFYKEVGDFEKSKLLFERTLEQYSKVLDKYHPSILLTQGNMGQLYTSQGVYDKAELLLERVLNLHRETLGDQHPNTLVSLNNLANLYEAQGAYDAAEPLRKRVLNLQRGILGVKHPDTLRSLANLGNLYVHKGAYDSAKPLLEEALRLSKETLGRLHPETLITLGMLASLYQSQGDKDAAKPLLEDSLRLHNELFGEQHPSTLSALNSLAVWYQSRGAFQVAEPLLEKALKLRREILGNNHPDVLISLSNLAILNTCIDENERATGYFLEGFRLSIEYMQLLSGFDTRKRRLFLRKRHEPFHNVLVSHFSKKPLQHVDVELLSLTLAQKGLLFQIASKTHQSAMASSPDSELSDYLYSLNRYRIQLSSQAQRAWMGFTSVRDEINQLIWKLEDLEQKIGNLLSGSMAITDDLEVPVLEAIPVGSVLVDFQIYDHIDFSKMRSIEKRVVALIADPKAETPVRLVNLGTMASVSKDLQAFRQAVSKSNNESLLKKAGKRLFLQLWKPLEPYLVGKNRVYLVPDGVLNLVPWGSLVDEKNHWLASTTDIAILASGRDFNRKDRPAGPGKAHLIFAPDYDFRLGEATHPQSNTQRRFSKLEGAQEEGTRLIELFKQHGVAVVDQSGIEATEALVSKIKSPSILHIATHGQFLGSDSSSPKSRSTPLNLFQTRNLESVQLPRPFELLPEDRPMLASGLALAGANGITEGRIAEDHTDGLLTALEILSMDLRGTELVVLSACDTGLGAVNNGDGVYSLNRAFLEAGAKNVLATLWKIDDKATVDFMESFYGFYLKGESARQALRTTQLLFMESDRYSHPYYWAPFVLVGTD